MRSEENPEVDTDKDGARKREKERQIVVNSKDLNKGAICVTS